MCNTLLGSEQLDSVECTDVRPPLASLARGENENPCMEHVSGFLNLVLMNQES